MRPYIAYFLLVIIAIISLWACTNSEGDSDIDIITPTDSLQGSVEVREMPQ